MLYEDYLSGVHRNRLTLTIINFTSFKEPRVNFMALREGRGPSAFILELISFSSVSRSIRY